MNQDVYFQLFSPNMSRGDKRKVEIIEAAIDCIAQLGIEKTTFEAIGDQLGIKKSHVNYHFSDKNVIIEYAIKYIATVAQTITATRVEKAKTKKAKIVAIYESAVDWVMDYPNHVPVLLLFYYYCTCNPKFYAINQQVRKAGLDRLRGVIDPQGKSTKSLEASQRIQDAITGRLLSFATTDKKIRRTELKKQLKKSVFEIIESSKITLD